MSRPLKILLGLASLWPLVYLFLFFGFIFAMVLGMGTELDRGGGAPGRPFIILFILHGLTMLWIMALLAFYIYDVFNNERVSKDKKALWAVVLFLGNMFAMPVYWYLYIWHDPAPAPDPEEQT